MRKHRLFALALGSCAAAGALIACTSDDSSPPLGETVDAGRFDATQPGHDGGGADASVDAGARDTGAMDAGANDAGATDTGAVDTDAGVDAGGPDAATNDAAAIDAGTADAGAHDAAADATVDAAACGSGAPTDLVAHWAAEGDAKDSTGAHDGTLTASGVTFGTGPAGLGQAFSFDGTTGYVALPDGIIPVNTTGFTLAAWFNPTALPTSDASSANALIFYGGANAGEYQLNVSMDGTVSCGLKLSDANWYWASSAPGTGTAGAWHLAICVLDGAPLDGGVDGGNSLQIWIDDQTSSTSIPALTLYQTGGFPSSIGTYAQDQYGNAAAFHGLVDDVRLYTRALTPGEVQGFGTGCTVP